MTKSARLPAKAAREQNKILVSAWIAKAAAGGLDASNDLDGDDIERAAKDIGISPFATAVALIDLDISSEYPLSLTDDQEARLDKLIDDAAPPPPPRIVAFREYLKTRDCVYFDEFEGFEKRFSVSRMAVNLNVAKYSRAERRSATLSDFPSSPRVRATHSDTGSALSKAVPIVIAALVFIFIVWAVSKSEPSEPDYEGMARRSVDRSLTSP